MNDINDKINENQHKIRDNNNPAFKIHSSISEPLDQTDAENELITKQVVVKYLLHLKETLLYSNWEEWENQVQTFKEKKKNLKNTSDKKLIKETEKEIKESREIREEKLNESNNFSEEMKKIEEELFTFNIFSKNK